MTSKVDTGLIQIEELSSYHKEKGVYLKIQTEPTNLKIPFLNFIKETKNPPRKYKKRKNITTKQNSQEKKLDNIENDGTMFLENSEMQFESANEIDDWKRSKSDPSNKSAWIDLDNLDYLIKKNDLLDHHKITEAEKPEAKSQKMSDMNQKFQSDDSDKTITQESDYLYKLRFSNELNAQDNTVQLDNNLNGLESDKNFNMIQDFKTPNNVYVSNINNLGDDNLVALDNSMNLNSNEDSKNTLIKDNLHEIRIIRDIQNFHIKS